MVSLAGATLVPACRELTLVNIVAAHQQFAVSQEGADSLRLLASRPAMGRQFRGNTKACLIGCLCARSLDGVRRSTWKAEF